MMFCASPREREAHVTRPVLIPLHQRMLPLSGRSSPRRGTGHQCYRAFRIVPSSAASCWRSYRQLPWTRDCPLSFSRCDKLSMFPDDDPSAVPRMVRGPAPTVLFRTDVPISGPTSRAKEFDYQLAPPGPYPPTRDAHDSESDHATVDVHPAVSSEHQQFSRLRSSAAHDRSPSC